MDTFEGNPPETAPPTPPAPVPLPAPGPPAKVVASLIGTSRWARFMAVLGFTTVGLMVLMSLVVLAVGFPGLPAGRLLGVVYLVFAGIYLIPLVPLNRFASATARLRLRPSYEVVGEALEHNRTFWRSIGILSIIASALAVLGMIIGLLVAVFAAMMAGSSS
jgi:hypothetical protein